MHLRATWVTPCCPNPPPLCSLRLPAPGTICKGNEGSCRAGQPSGGGWDLLQLWEPMAPCPCLVLVVT